MRRMHVSLCALLLTLVVTFFLMCACGGPTPTPAPTRTPLPPQPPQVIARSPQRGQEQSPTAPITIAFDQPMDQPAVEAAFAISPAVPGALQWQGNRLSFVPAGGGFARATTYRVTLDSKARSAAGLALPDAFSFQFRTLGYLEVTAVQPAPGTVDVASDAVISVMFNRPVVPLSDIQSQTGLALRQPLKFGPPVVGEGEWINTSLYTFRATPGFLPGTTYKAVVEPERLADISEAVLVEAYTWEFSVALPQVVSVMTSDPEAFVGPSPTISVTFNMPMDHASVEQRFALQPSPLHYGDASQPGGGAQAVVPGQFAWDGKTMGFTPSAPLSLDSAYVVRIAGGAHAAIGGEGTAAEFQWSFRTIGLPTILGTDPANGEQNVAPYRRLKVSFSSPINPESLEANLTILPTPTEVYTSWAQSNTQVYISFGAKPSTTYTVILGADIKGRYGHKLDQTYSVRFTTRSLDPSIYMFLDRVGTYNAYTTTAVYVQHVNVPRLDLSLYRLSRPDFLLLNSQDWWERWDKFRPSSQDLLRKWTVGLDSKLDAYLSTSVPLAEDGQSPLPPGFYYLEISAPGVSDAIRHMLVVSHANVTLKTTLTEALAWVTDLESGQPLPGVNVVIFGGDAEVLASGRTDNDGIFLSKVTAPTELDPWAPIMAVAGSEEAPAVASTDWSAGIGPWHFNLPYDAYLDPYRAYLYTDRSIYRPGQTVYFKGILRADDDGSYSLPTAVRVMHIIVQDNQGKEIYRADPLLNDMGTVHGEFQLDQEAGLGSYYLNAELDGRFFGTSFQVAEYRKPEFVVTVSTDGDEYAQGDEIAVSVAASYYFGGPVANAKVSWRLMSQDFYFNWTGQGYYDFNDFDWESRDKQTMFGNLVTVGQGVTDAEGRFEFKLPADVATRKNSQVFTIEASITDPSNQEVSARTSAVVHKGLFYIGLAPEDYIGSAGRESRIRVITVDWRSATVPNIPVTIVFLEQKWYNVQRQADDGRFYWDWKLEETPVYTTTVTTDGAGRAVAAFTPGKGGTYRARAFGRDGRENEIRSSTYLWVSSADFVPWRQENNDRIELVTDKKTYRPGETARILIPSLFHGPVKALLTVERGHIISHRLLTLTSNSEQVDLPVLSEYAPNVYVSVVVIKGVDSSSPVPSYRVGYASIDLSTEEKELTIQITPDRQTPYSPASKATFEVRATDHTGHGVEAELSLQVVDLSVLALTDNTQGTLLESFYRSRSLAVRTGAALAISVDRAKEQTQPPSGKGGSGLGPAGEDLIRKDFLDTAYWDATVRTDAEGRAAVTVDLPDNLTTWRVTGKAITSSTLVGEGSADIMTSKDLLIRAIAPRFFVIGDQVQLGAVVHNNTAQALTVDVSLQGTGIVIENATQRVVVAAEGTGTVSWPTRVTSSDSAVLTWRATSGTLSDGLELTLPVYHYSTPEVVATAGQVPQGETRIETVLLPDRLDVSQGELTVQLDPSLAAGMRDGLKYLETYPYDCIEQTVSRFLPNVMTYHALKELGISSQELEAQLPQYVSLGLQRLYALQHYDGGWGWWLSDESNPFITAYALLGMNEAAQAGFAVDRDVMDRAARYLLGALETAQIESKQNAPKRDAVSGSDTQAFVLYVLAECGRGDLGRTVVAFENRETLRIYGKAFLMMALQLLEPQEHSRINTLLSDVTNAAILSATGAHWEEQDVDYWTMNTNTRTTAIVLEALLRNDPQSPLLPNVVRWLMTARKEGHWETTQETAWSVMALTDFMLATGELQADYDYRVTVNALALAEATVTAQDVGSTRKLAVPMEDLLREQPNRIILERRARASQTGQGQLYYSLYLRYFLPVEDVAAMDRGIVVSRQYTLVDKPEQPISTAQVGDVIRVKLTVIAPNDLHYLVFEDPLPAGCEALDASLKTTSTFGESVGESAESYWSPYWWYFAESQLRDEKVALFATYLHKGTYEYTYLMRASISGRFLTMPTQAYEMYFPEVSGRSDGTVFTIGE